VSLTERAVPVMLAMAAEVEDEDEWHKNVGDEEDKVHTCTPCTRNPLYGSFAKASI